MLSGDTKGSLRRGKNIGETTDGPARPAIYGGEKMYKTYRLYFQNTVGGALVGDSPRKTNITFKARSEAEANKKAKKYFREAQIIGAFQVKLEQ